MTLSPADIAEQQERLASHRERLAVYLRQVATLGSAHAPPGVIAGVAEARRDIARIKAVLRAAGVAVEEHPDDAAPRGAAGPIDASPAPRPALDLPLDTVPDPAPLPPGSRVPFVRNPLFVGRADDLLTLAAALTPRGGAIAVTTGIGGVGKTQLAAEFAHRYGQFFTGGVFWLAFADPAAVDAEIAACGGAGGLGLFSAADNLPLAEQVAHVYRAWAEPTPRLLIFDNCDDLPTADAAALLADRLPTTGGCRILVTSRRGQWPRELALATHALGVLPRTESLTLLRRYRADLSDADAAAIAAELGDLPLALTLAGSYLDTYRGEAFSVPAAYLANLRKSRLAHRSLRGAGASISLTAHERSVAATFDLSYQRLDAADPTDALAIAALARAACLAPGEPFPRDLLLATLSAGDRPADDEEAAERRADAIARLLALGLIESATDTALRMHRLIVDFVGDTVVDPEALSAIEVAVAARSYDLYSKGLPASFALVQIHLRHLAERAFARADRRVADLCYVMALYLKLVGDYAAARPLAERALTICEEALGPNHPHTAQSLHNLAVLFQAQGDYAAALPLYERALAIRVQALGPTHLDTAQSLNDLALLLKTQGDYAAALPLYERALQVAEQALDLTFPTTATSLENLALLLKAQGDYAAARPLYERALQVAEQALDLTHTITATSLENLAGRFHAQRNSTTARPLYERALAIYEHTLGPTHLGTATSLNNLAMLLQDQGDYASARPLLERALQVTEQARGPTHPDTATSLNNLAALFQDQGDYAAARPLFERALAICEHALGPTHPDTASSLHNLAALLQDQGDDAAARPLFERALAIFEEALGPDHPHTQVVRNNLAALDRSQPPSKA